MQNLEFFKLSGKLHMISKAVDNLTEYRKMLLHDFRVNNTKLLSVYCEASACYFALKVM